MTIKQQTFWNFFSLLAIATVLIAIVKILQLSDELIKTRDELEYYKVNSTLNTTENK